MRLRTVASESTMVKVVSSGEGFGDSTEGAKIVWGFNLFRLKHNISFPKTDVNELMLTSIFLKGCQH